MLLRLFAVSAGAPRADWQGNGNGGGGSGGSAKAPRAGAAAQEKWKGTTAITFDVFDTERVITPLQLQLTVSAALGFDERDVIIEDQDEADIFYRVVVQRADASLKAFVNGPDGILLLNSHAARFDATLFLARPATSLPSFHASSQSTSRATTASMHVPVAGAAAGLDATMRTSGRTSARS